MNNQFLNHLNSITPQGRAKDTSIFVPAKDINEAVPDVGQNIRGMPKKAGRKFAQALHNLAQDRGSLEDYQAARERYTKKKASNAQRQGRNLDRAVQSFKTRTRMDEATSKGDPKRGHFGRAIPKVMPGEDPYDKYTRGEIKNFSGKLQTRLNAMSPEGRRSYYQRMGMRSRAASRGGKTQRLFPMTEAPKYAQDAIPAVPELLMLTYSNKHKRDADGLKKFVGKGRKIAKMVAEETAEKAKKFEKNWSKLVRSPAWYDAHDGVGEWRLTGHNAGTPYGSTRAIENTKEKIFGKRQGHSHLFWIHSHHGLITHPAHGDTTHHDVQDNPRKGIQIDGDIQKKVKDTSGSIVGQGRIEHHEGGGGIISYSHKDGSPRSAAVRTIARAYPKHIIHDGRGGVLEEINKQKWKYRKFGGGKIAKMMSEGAVKASMEDWLSDLPKPVIRELKAKHGKILARTGGHTKGIGGIGAKNSAKLHQSIQGILQKHNVPKLMGSHAEGSNAIQMSFHTFHGDLHEQKEVVYEGAVKASMEDWLYVLPKGAIRELKAKHGKHLAQTGMGGKDPKGLDSSVHGILQKHNVPPLMGSHRNSVDAVKMSFHTFHGDLHEQKEVDDEGGMAMGELKSIIANANDIMSMLKSDSQLEGWVQSKITKSADYISSVKDYLSNTPNSISEEEEKRESTKSMIARLVARGHKKIGKPIPKNVLRDIEKEHKNEDDDYEDD
jgi:hypothetical protein